jgi:hypothetical protein
VAPVEPFELVPLIAPGRQSSVVVIDSKQSSSAWLGSARECLQIAPFLKAPDAPHPHANRRATMSTASTRQPWIATWNGRDSGTRVHTNPACPYNDPHWRQARWKQFRGLGGSRPATPAEIKDIGMRCRWCLNH